MVINVKRMNLKNLCSLNWILSVFIFSFFILSDDTWIGLGDRTQEFEWRWLNGDPLSYENFAPGEPHRLSSNCIQVYSSAQ